MKKQLRLGIAHKITYDELGDLVRALDRVSYFDIVIDDTISLTSDSSDIQA